MSDAACAAVNGWAATLPLALVHPATGETMQWKSRLPADMRALFTSCAAKCIGQRRRWTTTTLTMRMMATGRLFTPAKSSCRR